MTDAAPADPPEPDPIVTQGTLPDRVLRYDPPPPAPPDGSQLVAALARARVKFGPIVKSKTAYVKSTKGDYDYHYADLSDVIEATTGALSEQGLVVLQLLEWRDVGDGSVKWWLVTRLAHLSGELVESLYLLPNPLEMRPQEIGSAITYARRYSYCAIVGVQAEEDDDARQAESAAAGAGGAKRTTQGGLGMGARRTPPPPAQRPAQPPATNASGDVDDQAGRGEAPPSRRVPPSRGGGTAPPRGSATPPARGAAPPAQAGGPAISEGQRKMLFAKASARARALGFEGSDAAHTILHDLLGDFGVRSVSDLPAVKMDPMLRAIDGYEPELRGGEDSAGVRGDDEAHGG